MQSVSNQSALYNAAYTRVHNFNVVLHLLINASRAQRLERGNKGRNLNVEKVTCRFVFFPRGRNLLGNIASVSETTLCPVI